jgi:hypothetical protein
MIVHSRFAPLGLLVLLGKHEFGDLDWRGHRAVALRRDRHEVNFVNKIVKQPESVGRKLGKEKTT